MSIDTVRKGPLDIGEVLSDTFTVLGRTFVLVANVAVMFVAIPAVIRIAGAVFTPVSPVFGIVTFIGFVATLVGWVLAYASIIVVAMADLRGQTVASDVMFRTAARKFWPMLGLAVLMSLGVGLGLVLLIVPGVILGLAWSVAWPAVVLEDRGVFAAFGRSAALTRGRRWSIFLLYFMVVLITVIVEVLLFAIFGGFQGLLSRQANTTSLVLSSLLSVITVPFGAVLSTSLFDHLRGKEAHAESVAEVFA